MMASTFYTSSHVGMNLQIHTSSLTIANLATCLQLSISSLIKKLASARKRRCNGEKIRSKGREPTFL